MLMYTHKVWHVSSLLHVPKTSPTRMNKWGKNCTWLLLSVPDRGLHEIRKDMWHFNYCKFCKLCTWSFQSEEFSSLFALLHYLHYSHFLRQNSTILTKNWTIHIPLPSPSSGSPSPKCGVHSIVLHCYTMSEIILNWTWYIPKLQWNKQSSNQHACRIMQNQGVTLLPDHLISQSPLQTLRHFFVSCTPRSRNGKFGWG